MLTVKIPPYLSEVSTYIFEVIFKDFWKLDIEIEVSDVDYYSITHSEYNISLNLPCHFILAERSKWLGTRLKSDWGIGKTNFLNEQDFPIFFDKHPCSIKLDSEIDFLGTIFFLLNRYHEHVEDISMDRHDRVLPSETFLISNGLIKTPIADLYLKLFKNFISEKLNLQINENQQFNILPSHDVDRPFEYLYYTNRFLLKRIAGDIIQRRSVQLASNRLKSFKSVKSGNLDRDPFNTFDWIMKQSENHGLKSTFHFISRSTNVQFDQEYALTDIAIQNLMSTIHKRGHQLALHPSYGATEINLQIKLELDQLKDTCDHLSIAQDEWKSRNHYLRWNGETMSELEKSGIHVDQTLGFAQVPGFRCGTSKRFKAFNFKKMKTSSVSIEPLILMEQSLFSNQYLNLRSDLDKAHDIASSLKKECEKYSGNFTILWHNNHLLEPEMKEFYQECLK